ncbi:hypothetical protein [Nocardioides plantarum]|uniref:Uncharacterized protein n=1 Tax=Nocardioides plantarum TaxID=29299 RepID=A0ABV5K8K1_9ACTN|nr:hypothetical protein [Nocardioides plantarum]
MPARVMFVQLKTGHPLDQGPAWVGWVHFTKSWRTAHFHDRTLQRVTGTAGANNDANFVDAETREEYWISGPKRDRSDARYSSQRPIVEDDARDVYEAFLSGARLPGRENG